MQHENKLKSLSRRPIDVLAVGTLNPDIIIIGDAPRDFKKLNNWVAPSRVEICTAGSIGYAAIDLARLGLKVSMFSTVANDALGRLIVSSLEQEGIDTRTLFVEKNASSGIGVYMLLFGSRKRPLTGRLATHGPWPAKISPAVKSKLEKTKLLHCAGYLHYPDQWGKPTEELFRAAKQRKVITSLDPQFPFGEAQKPWLKYFGNLLHYVDILFTDEIEACAIVGTKNIDSAAEKLIAQGPSIVVVKQGAKGALLVTPHGKIFQPAFKAREFTDSIGAGDAFDAGVIYAKLAGMDLKGMARFAAATASLTLKGMGGTQTAPNLKQVKTLLSLNHKKSRIDKSTRQ
jgi:sugar/nucleoside kinase (ribokinase family)